MGQKEQNKLKMSSAGKSLQERYRHREVFAIAIVIFFVWIFTLPFLKNIGNFFIFPQKNVVNGWYDLYFNALTYRTYILDFNMFPFWYPFREGGAYGLGIPMEISLSPLSVLILVFGVIKGLNIS